MKVGFSGTRMGMTFTQKMSVRQLLKEYSQYPAVIVDELEFHDGDCLGADDEAHKIADELGYRLVLHPPIIESKRAFNVAHAYRIKGSYLERNREIVNETDVLIAAPSSMTRKEGGTWYTIKYAISNNKKVFIVDKEGRIYPEAGLDAETG